MSKTSWAKKTQSGFYKTELTPEWEKIRKVINPATLEYETYTPPDYPCLAAAKKAKTLPEKMKAVVYGQDKAATFAWKVIANNLIYAANRIPEISDTIVEIDNAMKWGFNFEMGPFETWDAIDLPESVSKMQADGFAVPEKITMMLNSGHTSFYKTENGKTYYYDFAAGSYQEQVVSENIVSLKALKGIDKVVMSSNSATLIDLDDGVFCFEFNTKMNTINTEIIDFLGQSLDYVDNEGVGLVIGNQAGGMPGAFSAGADLTMVLEAAKDKRYSEIESMLERLQTGLQGARYAYFPVVAAPFGLTLAGGCEFCLAADRIVAHAELYMGLVEIGVGLLPAGCGCLNLWKNFVTSIPGAVTEVDLAKFFIPTFMAIATAKVSTSAAEARSNGFLRPTDRIVFNRDYLIGEAKKEVLKMVDAGYAPEAKRKVKVLGESAPAMTNAELFNMVNAKFVSEYDAFLAQKIAYVISGGDVRADSEVDEDVILKLERQTFVELLKEEKTLARIEHILKTGKPLRN